MRRVKLFSGRTVTLASRPGLTVRPLAPAKIERGVHAPLFHEARRLFSSGDVELASEGKSVDLDTLPLADFHALRAIATRLGWLAEETVDITCRNCDAPISLSPCGSLPLGPFEDGARGDPELDRGIDLDVRHPIPEIGLSSGRIARDVLLSPRTVGEATPLHVALTKKRLVVNEAVISGLGVVALGEEKRPAALAEALRGASDEAFDAVCELFLLAHYPPRLFALVRCVACGARNDVDAPFDREFDVGPRAVPHARAKEARAFPDFDAFAARAHERFAKVAPKEVQLVVDGGVAACDDGGDPLLGSYVPEAAGDATSPSRSPEVAIYFRTFRAIFDEEGAYDWEAEVDETIEHELEHHRAYLEGDDPTDEEERLAIDREAMRIHGRKALLAAEAHALRTSSGEFLRRTWPIWLLLALLSVAAILAEK